MPASSVNAFLTGAFLDDITHHSYKIYHLPDDEGVSESKLKELNEKDNQLGMKSITKFKTICEKGSL